MNDQPTQTYRNLIPVFSPYVCVVALQFVLLYPLHATMDLPAWDEAVYMGQGEQFLHGGTLGPISGSPVYALLYSFFVKLFGTVDGVFYMQYFVKLGVSTLLLLFLVEYLQSRLPALLLTLIWVVAGTNVWETVLVYHVALGFFLLALIFLNKNSVATFPLLFLCALTRLEYIFPALALSGYMIFTNVRRRTKSRAEPATSKGTHLPRLAACLLTALPLYAALNIDDFNPGTERTWSAFNQNYSRHEVEAGRYKLNPYIDSNVVMANDFPGADSLTSAFLINPQFFSKHLLRNISMLPKATMEFCLPYPYLRHTLGLLYGVLLGFAITALTQAAVINHRLLFSELLAVIRERKRILYLTAASASALMPILLVYPLPHHTLMVAPFCLLWTGLAGLRVFRIIGSPKFTRWGLTVLNLLFILSILVVHKPYASERGGRAVYGQVTQLIETWPKEKLKLMGVGAAWYASYLGSQNVVAVEPLATVYGEKIENDSSDLRALIKRHNPDVVLVNDLLVNSKNFDAASLEVLNSDEWIKYPVGNDVFYFLKEKLKR